MWKLYAGQHKGIAICTTPDRMRAAFRPFRLKPEYGHEELWAGPVEYADLTQVRMKDASMLRRFFFKHRPFEWEREFRLAISLSMAEEFAVSVLADGIFVDVDLGVLVDRIVLGSTTTTEERATVANHVERAGLRDRPSFQHSLARRDISEGWVPAPSPEVARFTLIVSICRFGNIHVMCVIIGRLLARIESASSGSPTSGRRSPTSEAATPRFPCPTLNSPSRRYSGR